MSQENVDLVRALFPAPDTDAAPLIRSENAWAQYREAFSPHATDDYETVVVWPGDVLTYRGLEGARQFWLDWLEPWATYRSSIDEVIDAGNRVLVLLRDHGRRKDMDAEVELIGAAVWTIRGGKVARIEHHADRATALKAVGLSE
jgi:ketosteroid isomerase-like protein